MQFHGSCVGSGLWTCEEFSNTSCSMVQFVTIKKTITVMPEVWFIYNLRQKNNTIISGREWNYSLASSEGSYCSNCEGHNLSQLNTDLYHQHTLTQPCRFQDVYKNDIQQYVACVINCDGWNYSAFSDTHTHTKNLNSSHRTEKGVKYKCS